MSMFVRVNKKTIVIVSTLLFILCLIYPSLRIAGLSIPAEDDWAYARNAMSYMAQEHSLIDMSLHYTAEYYMNFAGSYSSTFLGYLLSGIIMCDITGIRMVVIISMLFFFGAVFAFVYSTGTKFFNVKLPEILLLYCIYICLISAITYYADNENFFWFITSIQYLFLLSCGLISISLTINAVHYRGQIGRVYILAAGFFMILSCGANLCITAFICMLCMLFLAHLILWRKQNIFYALCTSSISMICALVNALAPGYRVRKGETDSILGAIYTAMRSSGRYTFERIEEYLSKP